MASMNELFKARVVIASDRDGSVMVFKNANGPLVKEEALRSFIDLLKDEERELLQRLINERERAEF